MPTPIYRTTDQARGTKASYATAQIAGVEMVYAWQGDQLIYMVLGRKKAEIVTKMKAWFPGIHFTESKDDQDFAGRIEKAWRADRLTDVPMTLYGTPFRHSVWKALLEIPANAPVTYGDIAVQINNPRGMRAVGSSVGANPVCLLVPCHRVLPKSGGVGNYGCGPDIKDMLLKEEAGFKTGSKKAA
jgi:O-6-methylguanine DNA methyltransferase